MVLPLSSSQLERGLGADLCQSSWGQGETEVKSRASWVLAVTPHSPITPQHGPHRAALAEWLGVGADSAPVALASHRDDAIGNKSITGTPVQANRAL